MKILSSKIEEKEKEVSSKMENKIVEEKQKDAKERRKEVENLQEQLRYSC